MSHWRWLCALVCVWLHSLAAAESQQQQQGQQSPPICTPPSLVRALLHSLDDDLVVEQLVNSMTLVPRVFELNESTTLEQALNSVWTKEDANVMLLLYAAWCPFSKLMRPLFETMSSVYPSVYHVALEESIVRPSVLSKYGVNSFPTLLHLTSSNSRTRYHGPKSLKHLIKFYKEMTGISPDLDGTSEALTVHLKRGRPSEVCPYPQAISPQKWLQDDMYLTLATGFLLFRVMLYLLPFATKSFKWWWKKWSDKLSLSSCPSSRSQQQQQHQHQHQNQRHAFAENAATGELRAENYQGDADFKAESSGLSREIQNRDDPDDSNAGKIQTQQRRGSKTQESGGNLGWAPVSIGSSSEKKSQ